MNNKYILSLLLLIAFTISKGQESHTTDGPYIFYQNGKRLVKMIKDGKLENSNGKSVVSVVFDHSNMNFKVKLKHRIINEPSLYEEPEKIFTVSDIEGEFDGFRNLLIANKIIDGSYNWIFGKGHLVICGDLFDRGIHVTEYLWLLYSLEEKAKASGGYVHVILGNHDIMNLSGDFRYVKPKYFETAMLIGLDYSMMFGEKTELGRWLRSKNVIEKIGDQLFLHGGLSPKIVALNKTLEEINGLSRPYYAKEASLIPHNLKVLFGNEAPFWYRGYFMSPRATMAELDTALKLYECSRIVVGHTIVDSNIAMYYGGKVIGIDVDHHASKRHYGAMYLKGKWFVADDYGNLNDLLYNPQNDGINQEQIQ